MSQKHYWRLVSHIHLGDQRIRLEHCESLGICRQTVVQSKGYRVVEQFCFFAGENNDGDPVYTLREILTEARYREAVRLGDEGLEEVEAIAAQIDIGQEVKA